MAIIGLCFEFWCLSILSKAAWRPKSTAIQPYPPVTDQGINRRLIASRQCWRMFIRSGHGVGGTVLPKRCPGTCVFTCVCFFSSHSKFVSLPWLKQTPFVISSVANDETRQLLSHGSKAMASCRHIADLRSPLGWTHEVDAGLSLEQRPVLTIDSIGAFVAFGLELPTGSARSAVYKDEALSPAQPTSTRPNLRTAIFSPESTRVAWLSMLWSVETFLIQRGWLTCTRTLAARHTWQQTTRPWPRDLESRFRLQPATKQPWTGCWMPLRERCRCGLATRGHLLLCLKSCTPIGSNDFSHEFQLAAHSLLPSFTDEGPPTSWLPLLCESLVQHRFIVQKETQQQRKTAWRSWIQDMWALNSKQLKNLPTCQR